jgi:hypothetical protein
MPMKQVIEFDTSNEARALPILLRHSPGVALHGRTYVVEESAARELSASGIHFTEIGSKESAPALSELSGERV